MPSTSSTATAAKIWLLLRPCGQHHGNCHLSLPTRTPKVALPFWLYSWALLNCWNARLPRCTLHRRSAHGHPLGPLRGLGSLQALATLLPGCQPTPRAQCPPQRGSLPPGGYSLGSVHLLIAGIALSYLFIALRSLSYSGRSLTVPSLRHTVPAQCFDSSFPDFYFTHHGNALNLLCSARSRLFYPPSLSNGVGSLQVSCLLCRCNRFTSRHPSSPGSRPNKTSDSFSPSPSKH